MRKWRTFQRCLCTMLAWIFFLGNIPFESSIGARRALASGGGSTSSTPPTPTCPCPPCDDGSGSSSATPTPTSLLRVTANDDKGLPPNSGSNPPPSPPPSPTYSAFNGEERFNELIVSLPGPYQPMELRALYYAQSGDTGLFGNNWFLNWERTAALQGTTVGSRQITISIPDQQSLIFLENSSAPGTFTTTNGWKSTASIVGSTIVRDLACGSKEVYDMSTSKLTNYIDKGNNTIQFWYDASTNLTTIIDALNRTNTIHYTGSGFISSIGDWTGRTWSFSYSKNNEQLEGIIYPPTPDAPSGRTHWFTYSTNGVGLVDHVGWDSASKYMWIAYGTGYVGKVEGYVADGMTYSNKFSYSTGTGSQTTIQNYDGSQDTYVYDSLTFLVQHSRTRQSASSGCPESSWTNFTDTATFTNNERGQSTNTTTTIGLTTVSAFNQYGEPLTNTQTDTNTGLSKTWIYAYGPNGCGKSLRTVSDPLGNTTTIDYEFDEGGGDLNGDGVTTGTRPLPVRITQPAVTNGLTGAIENPTTLIRYDSYGRVTWLRDASQRTNTFAYTTTNSHPISVSITGGGATLTYQFTYDPLDHLTSVITPAGLTNTLAYDALDRLTNYTSNLSTIPTIGLTYDQWNNVTSINDTPGGAGGMGGMLQSTYDTLGALASVTNAFGNPTIMQYNSQHKVQSVTRPLSREDQYQYRSDGVLSKVFDALSNPTAVCYDNFGRAKQMQDANGHTYQFQYDAWNRLTKETYADSSFDAYVYDGMNHVTAWTNRAGQATTYQYDALGRLVKETRPGAEYGEGVWTYKYLMTGELKEVRFNGSSVTSSYTYDGLGRLTQQGEYGRTLQYSYDTQGRRNNVAYPDSWQISELRDAVGRLTNISSAVGLTNYFDRSYDGMGRVKQDKWFGGAVTKNYLYDAAGQLTNWTVVGNSWCRTNNLRYDAASRMTTQVINGVTITNSYDLTDQLTNSTGVQAYSATYDGVGNRQTADGFTYSKNSVNGYTKETNGSTTHNITYDANGNVSNIDGYAGWEGGTESLELQHDSQGQIIHAGLGFCSSVSYDNDYRRLRVDEDGGECGGVTTYTYDARGNLLDLNYLTDGFRVQYAYADSIDGVVLMRTQGSVYAMVSDHLGSVVAIADHTGTLGASGQYHPFGDDPVGLYTYGNVLGFTGREFDSITGLYYFRNRWYSPDLGRFMEPDGIGLAGGDVNLYRYVGNSPMIYIDPSGRVWHLVVGALVGAVSGALSAYATGDRSTASILTGAFSGAVGGFVTALTLNPALGGLAAGAVGGFLGAYAHGDSGAGMALGTVLGGAAGFVGGRIGGAIAGWDEGLIPGSGSTFGSEIWGEIGSGAVGGIGGTIGSDITSIMDMAGGTSASAADSESGGDGPCD